jgi:cytochrome c biogenesis protein CcdA
MSTHRTVCPVPAATRHKENRGLAWVLGAFVICPCHLPVTLAIFTTVLSGTALGALIAGHPYVAGVAITVAWIAATWRGIRYLQSARTPSASVNDTARTSES